MSNNNEKGGENEMYIERGGLGGRERIEIHICTNYWTLKSFIGCVCLCVFVCKCLFICYVLCVLCLKMCVCLCVCVSVCVRVCVGVFIFMCM